MCITILSSKKYATKALQRKLNYMNDMNSNVSNYNDSTYDKIWKASNKNSKKIEEKTLNRKSDEVEVNRKRASGSSRK